MHQPALRERLREGLRRLLAPMDQVSRSLYLALILGDQGEITPQMRQAFSRTGTSHLLAISGLHLGMLAGLSFLAFFWLLKRFPRVLLRVNAVKLATVLAAGPVVAYAWIAGGSPSTQRAEIMILAYLLLVLAGRPREVVSALALAALVILVLSPLLLFSLSFQLSFISVAALIYFLPRWVTPPDYETLPRGPVRKWSRRAIFWVKGALLASLVATLATAPLVAASFHLVSILGVVINLAAIPLVNGLAVPLGLLALTAESVHLTPLAQGLLNLGQVPLKLAYGAISWGAAVPGSALTLPAPTWLQIALFYALVVLVFPPKRTAATWGGTVLAAAILVVSVAAPLHRTSQACELTCLDSYTGLAGVLVTPDDRRLVISAGWPAWPGREGGSVGPLPGYLHWRQFRRLDEVMALSLTSQNAPELLRVAQDFRLGKVWFAGGERRPEVIQLRNLLGDQGHPARSLVRGDPPAALGEVKLAYYALESGRGAALGITCAGRRVVMFPPSSLSASESTQAAGEGPLEALVVPRELSPEWLAALKPKYVIVYGMPEKDLPRLKSPPQVLFLYTREGAISLYFTSKGLSLKQWQR
jgi:competence protein ComEC